MRGKDGTGDSAAAVDTALRQMTFCVLATRQIEWKRRFAVRTYTLVSRARARTHTHATQPNGTTVCENGTGRRRVSHVGIYNNTVKIRSTSSLLHNSFCNNNDDDVQNVLSRYQQLCTDNEWRPMGTGRTTVTCGRYTRLHGQRFGSRSRCTDNGAVDDVSDVVYKCFFFSPLCGVVSCFAYRY